MDLRSQLLVILAAASSWAFPQEIPVESPLVTTQSPPPPSASTPPGLPPPPVNVTDTKIDLLGAQDPVQGNLTSLATPLLGPALGASCNETDVCQAEDSSCKNSKCTCNEGFVQSKFNPKCLKVVNEIGGDCYESGQCTWEHADHMGPRICLNFKCSCDIGWAFYSDDVCTQPSELDTVCNSTDDCNIPNSFCSNNICTCLANYVPAPDNTACSMMLRLKSEGDTCSEDADCQKTLGELAVCSLDVENGRCKCPRGTYFGAEEGICMVMHDAASSNSLSLLLLGLMFLMALTGR